MFLRKIFIAGGAGYIGSVLVPKLIKLGHSVTVIDLMIFGNNLPSHPKLKVIDGDINNECLVSKHLEGQDIVINLAVISDEPAQQELEAIRFPTNLTACFHMAQKSKELGIKKFIYASSTSVYGSQESIVITENTKPNPLTDYAKFKLECEKFLLSLSSKTFCVTCVRPSTVFGYSPRQRFDLMVNYMIASAYLRREIPVAGAKKIRPNVHIEDITDFYIKLIEQPAIKINHEIFNVACNNMRVEETATKIQQAMKEDIKIRIIDSTDHRSYNISAQKLNKIIYFYPSYSIEDGVKTLESKMKQNEFNNPLENNIYFSRTIKDYSIK